MRKSKVLAKLRAGKPVFGANPSLGPSLITPGLAGKIGCDVVWIDMEHRWFTYQDMITMIYSAREGGADVMIRIVDHNPASFYRCFECGATGVMMYHCKSRQDAEKAVYNSKFAPVGRRGWENALIDGEFGLIERKEFIEHHNRETFVCVQIEDREAVDSIDEIVETPGLDLLFIGPGDLMQSYGVYTTGASEIVQAYRKIAQACAKHKNKWWGGACSSDIDDISRLLDMGARFLFPFVDYSAVLETWQREMEAVNNLLAKKGLE